MSRVVNFSAIQSETFSATGSGNNQQPETRTHNDTKTQNIISNIFYDEATKEYLWPRNSGGGWVRLNETSLRRHMTGAGISRNKGDSSLSPLDLALNTIQTENSVSYAGPLAGHAAGKYDYHGVRVLVTDSPQYVMPVPGRWDTLKGLIEGLFIENGIDQTPYLYGWLKVSIAALRDGNSRPGQALVIAGVSGCGKSLLQNLLTELLGGRSAKPYQYMTGATTFNADLFAAEHLMVEDEAASSEIRTRRKFGSEIKGVTVNETVRYHPKGKQAISLRPFWRLSITLNDEPENLMVLPPIDESLADKIILLRASRKDLPTDTPEKRKSYREALSKELPAFVDWLNHWEIPVNLKSSRFGITHFHHPELMQSISQLSPEMKLWGLIESTVLKNTDNWRGTAQELESALTNDNSVYFYEARRLLGWQNACGTYLSRLATSKELPGAVKQERSSQRREWVIQRPEDQP